MNKKHLIRMIALALFVGIGIGYFIGHGIGYEIAIQEIRDVFQTQPIKVCEDLLEGTGKTIC